MNLLHEYDNGNCHVQLFDDGTKIREYDGDPQPVFPESIDLKLTNKCDLNCTFCHEEATADGAHANIDWLRRILYELPAGVEIALGGGNPLVYPNLADLLLSMKTHGLVMNMTVNAKHLMPYHTDLLQYRERLGWITALGISYASGCDDAIREASDNNTVVHFIAGVHRIEDLERLNPQKALILGYKQHGRGKGHEVDQSDWRDRIAALMTQHALAFDNLALVQLNIKNKIDPAIWDKHYMGDDGTFTMYVDAVKQQFAKSSISPRYDAAGLSLYELFAWVRQCA